MLNLTLKQRLKYGIFVLLELGPIMQSVTLDGRRALYKAFHNIPY